MSEAVREAMLYEPVEGETVRCGLCGHRCTIMEGKYGRCMVRRNVNGILRSESYGMVVAMNVDPIEKKPLFHFLPGTQSLSIATQGCNFQCAFCQNWQISQPSRSLAGRRGRAVSPREVVAAAQAHGCASVSYTYTEPTIFFELAYDTAEIAKQCGLGNCFVSNGYMTEEAVDKIAPCLDAINVDLKAFRDETYRDIMKARLEPVLRCLRALVRSGVWVEVTTLIVPDMNDSESELADIAGFIADELSPSVPWHVSRFHGDYKMDGTPSTPVETLEAACRLGREAGLRHVYCGNVPGAADESTRCPYCGEMIIERMGYVIRRNRLADGQCPKCKERIDGVWSLQGG